MRSAVIDGSEVCWYVGVQLTLRQIFLELIHVAVW